jgi:hypothetical protein
MVFHQTTNEQTPSNVQECSCVAMVPHECLFATKYTTDQALTRGDSVHDRFCTFTECQLCCHEYFPDHASVLSEASPSQEACGAAHVEDLARLALDSFAIFITASSLLGCTIVALCARSGSRGNARPALDAWSARGTR